MTYMYIVVPYKIHILWLNFYLSRHKCIFSIFTYPFLTSQTVEMKLKITKIIQALIKWQNLCEIFHSNKHIQISVMREMYYLTVHLCLVCLRGSECLWSKVLQCVSRSVQIHVNKIIHVSL